MTGENVICFAKDWFEQPTSNNHVMTELAKSNRVLWINSVATRAPKLADRRDIGKICAKLIGFARGIERIRDNLWVYTPIVLPFPHSHLATEVNQRVLKTSLAMLRRKLGMRDFQLWTFLPNTAEYVGKMGESIAVYYCVDDWSKFAYLDGPRTERAERRLCQRADVVFGVAQSLVDRRMAWNPETHLARHGVDHQLFSRALDEKTVVPPELAKLPKPVVGMYGTLESWIDFELIALLARSHPEWSIVLIGKQLADLSALGGFPNVHILGRQAHSLLPNYCKGFSVGIIPYVVNARIKTVNPIKLREYLSAGLPVVATNLPEVRLYSRFCHVASDSDGFRRGIEEALRTDSLDLRRERSEAMRAETWERKVATICEHVMRVKRNKLRMKGASNEQHLKHFDCARA